MTTNAELSIKVDKLTALVEGLLNSKVEKVAPSTPEGASKIEEMDSKYPVPKEYREIVGTVLNKHFGIQLEPMNDSPAFNLTIVVPERYDTLTPAQREMHVADIRPKVISYADGVNGIRMWVEKVLSSFGVDDRVRIAHDRDN